MTKVNKNPVTEIIIVTYATVVFWQLSSRHFADNTPRSVSTIVSWDLDVSFTWKSLSKMHLDLVFKEIQDLFWEQHKLTHASSVMTLCMKQSNLHAPASNVASISIKATWSDLQGALYSMLIIIFTSRIAFITKPLTSDSRQSRAHHSPEHNVHSIKLRQVSCHLHVFLTDIYAYDPQRQSAVDDLVQQKM